MVLSSVTASSLSSGMDSVGQGIKVLGYLGAPRGRGPAPCFNPYGLEFLNSHYFDVELSASIAFL